MLSRAPATHRLYLQARRGLVARAPTVLTVGLLIALGSVTAKAQDDLRWRWSNPQPHGNNIMDMAVSDGLYVQVAERGRIFASENLDLWIPLPSPTDLSLRSVTFFQETIVVTGEAGTVVVGDSVRNLQEIRLDTTDWLEGVAASSDRLAAVGDNAAVYTSDNGMDWQRQPQPFGHWLRDVAYGNGTFVAVGEGGWIGTSTDGVSWDEQSSGVSAFLNSVDWVGDQFVAVGENGTVLASSDGSQWESLPAGASNPVHTASAGSLGLMVAGENELRFQASGQPWRDEIRSGEPAEPAPDWTYLSSLWDGALFLVGGRTGMLLEGFRDDNDQMVWVDRYESIRNWLWDVTYDAAEDLYVAVGDHGTVMTSDTGVDWTLELVPESLGDRIFLGVGHQDGDFLAVGNQGGAMISTNGVLWDPLSPPTDNDLQGVGNHNGQWVLTGGDGTILLSDDTEQWDLASTPTSTFLSSVDASNERLVAVGDQGTLLTSANGSDWQAEDVGVTDWIYQVRYLGDRFIAVGQNGTILTSPDGLEWTARESGTSRWLNAVTRVGDSFFVVGLKGTVLRSADGQSWEDVGTVTRKSLFGAADREGQLVTVGLEGVILRSQVVPYETPVTIESFTHESNRDAFLFDGRTDQRFELQGSPDLETWDSLVELEIYDSSGTRLFIREDAQTPSRQYYRTIPEGKTK